jgi:hypothetical protein
MSRGATRPNKRNKNLCLALGKRKKEKGKREYSKHGDLQLNSLISFH